MKRILYYTIFVLCAAACGQSAPQEDNTSTEYETMTVSRSDISLEETYPASIEGRQSIRIIPRVEGYLQDIKVKEGQRVRKGQVLFILDQANVGGVVLQIDKEAAKGDLELLFVSPECHSKGIGQAAWKAVEALHPEIKVWETITPYFEKRNIHFYVNRCGFHIVEFWNKYHHGPTVPEEMEENWSMDDEMFVFRKEI